MHGPYPEGYNMFAKTLEDRVADLERRVRELEQKSLPNPWTNDYPQIGDTPWVQPLQPVQPCIPSQPWHPHPPGLGAPDHQMGGCPVCGIMAEGTWGYVCQNYNCPHRVTFGGKT